MRYSIVCCVWCVRVLCGLCGVCNVHAWQVGVSSVICRFVCGINCAVCGVYGCVTFVDIIYVVDHSAAGVLIVWHTCDEYDWSVVCV